MKKYVCDVCGYIYDPAEGDDDNGVAAGTASGNAGNPQENIGCRVGDINVCCIRGFFVCKFAYRISKSFN